MIFKKQKKTFIDTKKQRMAKLMNYILNEIIDQFIKDNKLKNINLLSSDGQMDLMIEDEVILKVLTSFSKFIRAELANYHK